jgi:hypothetical protein
MPMRNKASERPSMANKPRHLRGGEADAVKGVLSFGLCAIEGVFCRRVVVGEGFFTNGEDIISRPGKHKKNTHSAVAVLCVLCGFKEVFRLSRNKSAKFCHIFVAKFS